MVEREAGRDGCLQLGDDCGGEFHIPDAPGLGYVVIFAVYGMLFLLSTLLLVKVQDPQARSEIGYNKG